MIKLRPHQQDAVYALRNNSIGQIIVPTGGGKTLIAIMDAVRRFEIKVPRTIVVVAPRILLAEQLSSEYLEHITNANVLHVHSGETKHFSTTKSDRIKLFVDMCQTMREHVIIFTTYHSLHRVQESGIAVDTIYFDEAHNSVQRNFYGPTEYFSKHADRCYYFTATRKTSVTVKKPGMNWTETYGQVIARVSAPDLVQNGYILPPKVKVIEMDKIDKKSLTPHLEGNNVLASIDQIDIKKILVCVKTTRQLQNLFMTDFADQLTERGYSYLYITAKTGAVIDGQKVTREEFFNTLNAWGRDKSKKFVVLHRSILSEGINVSELEAVIFLRNMDSIELLQTVGRVIRVGSSTKTYGMLCVPVYNNVGVSTEKALQRCVDIVFEKGEMYDSVTRR
ncbi:helicase [Synechococcus phage S-B43]|nr:helicase [Synechococcus phage S-B43]